MADQTRPCFLGAQGQDVGMGGDGQRGSAGGGRGGGGANIEGQGGKGGAVLVTDRQADRQRERVKEGKET